MSPVGVEADMSEALESLTKPEGPQVPEFTVRIKTERHHV